MDIGSTIRKVREENGLNQEQFAEKFHVTRQTVSNWENNKNYPDLETLVRISETYDIPLDTLLREDREYIRQKDREVRLSSTRKKLSAALAAGLVLLIAVITLVWQPWRHETTDLTVTAGENMNIGQGSLRCYVDDRQSISDVAGALSGKYEVLKEKIVDPEAVAYYVEFWDDPDGYWFGIAVLDETHIVYEGWECRKVDGPIDLTLMQEIMDGWPKE